MVRHLSRTTDTPHLSLQRMKQPPLREKWTLVPHCDMQSPKSQHHSNFTLLWSVIYPISYLPRAFFCHLRTWFISEQDRNRGLTSWPTPRAVFLSCFLSTLLAQCWDMLQERPSPQESLYGQHKRTWAPLWEFPILESPSSEATGSLELVALHSNTFWQELVFLSQTSLKYSANI